MYPSLVHGDSHTALSLTHSQKTGCLVLLFPLYHPSQVASLSLIPPMSQEGSTLGSTQLPTSRDAVDDALWVVLLKLLSICLRWGPSTPPLPLWSAIELNTQASSANKSSSHPIISFPNTFVPWYGWGAYKVANWRLTTYFLSQISPGGPSHSTFWCVIICCLRISAKTSMLTSFCIILYCSVTSPWAKSWAFHLCSPDSDSVQESFVDGAFKILIPGICCQFGSDKPLLLFF